MSNSSNILYLSNDNALIQVWVKKKMIDQKNIVFSSYQIWWLFYYYYNWDVSFVFLMVWKATKNLVCILWCKVACLRLEKISPGQIQLKKKMFSEFI